MKLSQMHIGLRAKTLFGLVIPIAILFVVLTYANEAYLTSRIKDNYLDSLGWTVDASVAMLHHHTPEEIVKNPEIYTSLLNESNPLVNQAVIFAAQGKKNRLERVGFDRREPAPLNATALHKEVLSTWRKISKEADGRIEIAAPLMFEDASKGVLAVTINLGGRDELIASLRARSIAVVGLGLLVLSAIIFLGLEHSFLGPLERLQQATIAVKKGAFAPPSTITHQDELGALTRSIKEMTDRLNGHTQALERRLSELTVLYNISKVASSSLDLDSTLGIILESAVKVTEATGGFIMLDRAGGDETVLELKASLGMPTTGEDSLVSQEIADYVAVSGGPLLLMGDITRLGFRQHKEFRDAIYAPVSLVDQTIGVIALINKRSGSFGKKDLQLVLTLANQTSGVINTARLFEDLQESYFSTIQALAAAIDAKDPYTRGHSSRVAAYSETIAAHLNLSPEDLKAVKIAAYLHDIGKIGIEEQILLKPNELTAEEFGIIRAHPKISAKILASVSFLRDTIPMVVHHHEHFDGRGYPGGLAGEDIPLGARVIAVADSFDAMTSDRPYRKALAGEVALEELERQAGTQFDPAIVKVFLDNREDAYQLSDKLVAPW